MYYFVKLILYLFLFGTFLIFSKKTDYFGGGIFFWCISVTLASISGIYKKGVFRIHKKPILSLSVIFACLYGFNMLYALQARNYFHNYIIFELLVGFSAVILLVSYRFLVLPVFPKTSDKFKLSNVISKNIIMVPTLGFMYMYIAALFFNDFSKSPFGPDLINVVLIIYVFAVIINYIYLRKINDKLIIYLVDLKNEYNVKFVWIFLIILIVLLGFGCLEESGRGYWTVLLLSDVFTATILICSWQIWKYLFIEHEPVNDISEIKPAPAVQVKPTKVFIMWLVVTLTAVLWAAFLSSLENYFNTGSFKP